MNWQNITNLFLNDPNKPLLFHTGFFLFIFSVFLIGYSFVFNKQKLRTIFIILFSFYFYYKASGVFALLLLFTVSADYLFSILITNQEKQSYRRLILFIGIAFSLSFLLYFKYRNFFLENLYSILGKEFSPLALLLPIGISFYTFQSISYLVDVYKRKVEKPPFLDYLMYMTFFPHIVAGPIVRAIDFLPQIKNTLTIKKAVANEAFYLITKGIIKKAIIADFVAQYSDIVFSAPSGFSGTEHILSTLCYSLQIFCDFSGYTDIAIGIALLLGFRLKLNFNSPYKAQNITDFWHRWHISLSLWLRDYIYIPLGGNRKGINLQLLFLFLTMLIGGFWHGADWKFVFWGAAHGVLLIVHKLFGARFPKLSFGKFSYQISWFITFCCVALLWIPFRALTMEDTVLIYTKIFSDSNLVVLKGLFTSNTLLFVLIFLGYFFTLIPFAWKEKIKNEYYKIRFYKKIVILIIVIQTIIQIRTSVVQPFIYFQF